MSFTGAQVTLEGFFPNLTVPRMTPQTREVGDGMEFPDIAQWDFPDDEVFAVNTDIDISSSRISTMIDQTGFSYEFGDLPEIFLANGEFNGIVFTFELENTAITGASLSLNEIDLPNNGLFFNANSIFINTQGLPVSDGERLDIDVSFVDTVPEQLSFDDAVFTARLYSAAFGREPDQPGLNFWINSFNDVGRFGMAEFFLDSPEFMTRFGDPVALSNESYLDVLYNNILGRDGDAAGNAFWLDVLTRETASRAEVLAYFVDSEENVSNTESFENVGVSAQNGEWILLS